MIFLEVKFGSVVNGIVDIAAGHGSVGYHCCSGDRCASEEPDDGNLPTLPREAAGMSKKTVLDKVMVKT